MTWPLPLNSNPISPLYAKHLLTSLSGSKAKLTPILLANSTKHENFPLIVGNNLTLLGPRRTNSLLNTLSYPLLSAKSLTLAIKKATLKLRKLLGGTPAPASDFLKAIT